MIARRLRSMLGGSYFVIGGTFMLWAAAFKSGGGLVRFVLLVCGSALALLGLLELIMALRRR
jgi:hypothetical protein